MSAATTITNSIINRVNKVNHDAEFGYVIPRHELYPKSWNEPFHYPYTVGGLCVPALNLIPEEEFNKEMEDEFNQTNVYQIGTLDFWDEIVEFFGSFQHNHALFTKLSLEEMREYDLPECFLHNVEVWHHPEENKWTIHSVSHGKKETTVICVLSKDGGISLYRRHI